MTANVAELAYKDYIDALEAAGEGRVLLDRPRDGVIRLTLDDADNMNALSGELTVELHNKLTAAVADREARVIVLTGKGQFFSVGGDWKLMTQRAHVAEDRAEGSYGVWQWIRNQFGGIARLISQTDKTVIVGLNGDVAGVALAWTLAADLVVAAESARLVTAFGRIGLVPEVGTNWALSRRLGHQKAFELFVTGRPLSSQEGAELGLVNDVVAADTLDAALDRWTDRVLRLPEHVVTMTKPLMRNAADMSWHQAIMAEEFAEPLTFTTQAHREAIAGLLGGAEKALR